MSNGELGVPIEQFIQALQTQLDRAQSAMRMKADNLDLPLTFAVKDLSLDLRTHIEVVHSEVRIRPAGPGEKDASTLHLALTTITRPMIKENAKALTVDADEPTLKEAVGDQLTDEEQKRLEWAGVHTVSQLRRLADTGADKEIERVAALPVDRLRHALARAARPFMSRIEPLPPAHDDQPDAPKLLRIRGRNLLREQPPRVSIGGEPVNIVRAHDRELLIEPKAHQFAGTLSIETAPGSSAEMVFDLQPALAVAQREGGAS